ncbi:MAG: aminopeptidase P family protein [Nitrososphaerota archaeon]|nr:aminopeptidase P family protein [Nitrososphaerota archaeon]MDG6983309.1 aminopeptidase P family protein [Nitrososphaerota archaeon]
MRSEVDYVGRLRRLRKGLVAAGLSGVTVVPGPNMRYFTGVNSLMLERPFMLLVPSEGDVHLVAPTLESGPYRGSPVPVNVHAWTDSEGPGRAITAAAKGAGMKGSWGFEGRVPFLYLDRLMKGAAAKAVDAEAVLQGLREIKDEAEVGLLKEAGAILSRAFEGFPGLIREGASELEVARAAADAIYEKGATKVDDMLVQSGAMAADPHHLPSPRKIARGESVVIDVGATYQGYYADVTRTFCIGASVEFERVYDKVLEAEEAGVEAAEAGVEVGTVDAAARDVLKGAGMGENFFHRTGHGLGLEVHEAPYIVEGGSEKLGANMCFTVEPGAYFRGKLGVRIEDDVLIEGRKGVAITDTPKDFGWWK